MKTKTAKLLFVIIIRCTYLNFLPKSAVVENLMKTSKNNINIHRVPTSGVFSFGVFTGHLSTTIDHVNAQNGIEISMIIIGLCSDNYGCSENFIFNVAISLEM